MVTLESDSKALGLAKKLKSLQRASKLLIEVVSSKSLPGTSRSEVTTNLLQPPFPYLLRSNMAPMENEISLIRDVIATAEVEKSRLEEMVGSSPHPVKSLNYEFGRTRQFIVEHKAILSSIRRIPPEILQDIFIHALPTPVKDLIPGSSVARISQLPWALSQVSQLWRVTMLSFSFMWRDLPVIDLKQAYTKEKRYLDFLTEMLKRSSNTPIRLSIVGNLKRNELVDHPAIDMLVLHSDRWEEIMIHFLVGSLPAFQKIKGRLSSLRSLRVSHCSRDRLNSMKYTVHDLFQNAPQLRRVDLLGLVHEWPASNGWPTNQSIFPTHHLVHYRQTNLFLNQAIQVILSSPSLRILEFSGFEDEEGNTLPMKALQLPDLTTLYARFSMSPFYEPFFNNLTIPAIESLRVETVAENVIIPICSMILRSGSPCLLKVLYLEHPFSSGGLPSLLKLTPRLTSLSTTLPPPRDISALVFNRSVPPLVPLLLECVFLPRHDVHSDLSTETIQALNLFASSRCELPDNITSAEMFLFGVFHPLRILRLKIGWQAISYQTQLQGWVYGDMGGELYKQRQDLRAMFPGLGCCDAFFKRKLDSKGKCKLKLWKSEVTGLLTHLETLKIEKASDICMSGIQYMLYAISIRFERGDVGYSFSLIAEDILKKWEPILRSDMQNLRWLSTGDSLTYISTTQNHALRSSPDAMKFFFYGIDSDTSKGASNSFPNRVIFLSMQHDRYIIGHYRSHGRNYHICCH